MSKDWIFYSIKTMVCMIPVALLAFPAVAQQAKPQKSRTQSQTQAPKKPQKATNKPLRGRLEKLSCKLGTEDRHARIAVELIGGRVKSLAYYSKWKPRTCSVYIVRDDAYSRWEDTGNVTLVTLNEEKGEFLIDHNRRSVKFLFRNIDRERFCGMEGKITGSLTVTRGRSVCELDGVMDENSEGLLRDVVPTEKPETVPVEQPAAMPKAS